MGKILRAIDSSKTFKIYIANTKDIVEEMRNIHKTSATATAALGRLTTLAGILSIDLKNEKDSITLKMKGDGPGGSLIAISYGDKTCKSYVENPKVDPPSKWKGKLDVGAFVGTNGSVTVIRDYGLKEPYSGVSNIVSGEVAEDFSSYFFNSEQTRTVLSLGVFVEKDLHVSEAGGIFLQAMPNVKEEEIVKVEKILKDLPSVTDILKEGLSNEEILNKYFSSLDPEVLKEEEVVYSCNCSRDKVINALASIDKDELRQMIEEDGKIEVSCQFCNSKYDFHMEDLGEIGK